MPKAFGLPKKERLKSRKSIDALFAEGKHFVVFPIRVSYLLADGEGAVQIGVGASKRNYKRAVDRNRIKRLLREAYRLQKTDLVEAAMGTNKKLIVFFTHIDKIPPTFDTAKAAMAKCLVRLLQKLNENPS
jgi:ribonuclease P protein component